MSNILYWIAVITFAAGGITCFAEGQTKPGVIGVLIAILNGIVLL